MIIVNEIDWKNIGIKYYKDIKDFKFKCPNCKHIQSISSIIDNNSKLTEKDVRDFVVSSCEGRYTDKKGCDWCLGGLFHIHEIEILQEDGSKFAVFEFASNEAMDELKRLNVDLFEIEKKKEMLSSGTLWICIEEFEAKPSSSSSHPSRIIKKGEIIEHRYFHPVHFRTLEDNYYAVNEGLFLQHCDFYGNILEKTCWENREKLKEILEKKLFKTKQELKNE